MISNEELLILPGAQTAPSLRAWAAVMGAMTVCAVTAGTCLGLWLGASTNENGRGVAAPPHLGTPSKYGGDTALRALPPIITNLADPDGGWIRVQASIVFEGKTMQRPDLVVAEIGDDILGFLRTLSLAQIGGASGLQHLHEDLSERARIRSGGLVRELILQSVVVQ